MVSDLANKEVSGDARDETRFVLAGVSDHDRRGRLCPRLSGLRGVVRAV